MGMASLTACLELPGGCGQQGSARGTRVPGRTGSCHLLQLAWDEGWAQAGGAGSPETPVALGKAEGWREEQGDDPSVVETSPDLDLAPKFSSVTVQPPGRPPGTASRCWGWGRGLLVVVRVSGDPQQRRALGGWGSSSTSAGVPRGGPKPQHPAAHTALCPPQRPRAGRAGGAGTVGGSQVDRAGRVAAAEEAVRALSAGGGEALFFWNPHLLPLLTPPPPRMGREGGKPVPSWPALPRWAAATRPRPRLPRLEVTFSPAAARWVRRQEGQSRRLPADTAAPSAPGFGSRRSGGSRLFPWLSDPPGTRAPRRHE